MEAFLRHWTICDNDNLWFVEIFYRMHVCTKDEVHIPVTQSSFESIRKNAKFRGCLYADFWINCALLRSFCSGRGEKLVTTSKGLMSSDNSQHFSITATFSRYGIQPSVRRYSSLPWSGVRALNILRIILGFYTCVIRTNKMHTFYFDVVI